MGGCFRVDDHHIPRSWNYIIEFCQALERQISYCMHVASHKKMYFIQLQTIFSLWCDCCLQTSIWLIFMGSHKRLTSLAVLEIQTLPSGPVLGTVNHDSVCAVSHKSNILVLSYNDYTLHMYIPSLSDSLSQILQKCSSAFRKNCLSCWNVCMNCQWIVIKEACTDQGSMHCFFLPKFMQ